MSRDYKAPIQTAIRSALRQNPDGLTASAIAAEIDVSHQTVCNAIRRMMDLYVDRWMPHRTSNNWIPVYQLKPEDAPKPEIKVFEYLKKTGQQPSIAV